jgi:hypothetical protein
MKLSDAINKLTDFDYRTSKLEDWVNNYLKELDDVLEPLSTMSFFMEQSLNVLLGKAQFDGDELPTQIAVYEWYKSVLNESGEGQLKADLERVKKLNKFFEEWDV